MRQLSCVAIEMTTVCNRACKDCCAGINMGLRTAVHHDWAYFERAAKAFYGVERVHITGGEPLTHPRFDEFAPKFRTLFGCRTLTVQTNGFEAERHAAALACFDHVYASRYDSRNAGAVDFIQINFPTTAWEEGEAGFTPRSRRGSGAVCGRGTSETVAYADGKLYGCCVAPGIPGAVGIEPTKNWKAEALKLPLPCGDCWFSPSVAA